MCKLRFHLSLCRIMTPEACRDTAHDVKTAVKTKKPCMKCSHLTLNLIVWLIGSWSVEMWNWTLPDLWDVSHTVAVLESRELHVIKLTTFCGSLLVDQQRFYICTVIQVVKLLFLPVFVTLSTEQTILQWLLYCTPFDQPHPPFSFILTAVKACPGNAFIRQPPPHTWPLCSASSLHFPMNSGVFYFFGLCMSCEHVSTFQ